jgi:hypothetical protein
MRKAGPHYLYVLRPVGFEAVPPVYVGITRSPKSRKSGHQTRWGIDLHLEVVGEFTTRQRALKAEAAHILKLIESGVALANRTVDSVGHPGLHGYAKSLLDLAKMNAEVAGVPVPNQWTQTAKREAVRFAVVSIPAPIHDQLRAIADAEGRKIQWLAQQALEEYIKAREGRK